MSAPELKVHMRDRHWPERPMCGAKPSRVQVLLSDDAAEVTCKTCRGWFRPEPPAG